MGFFSHKIIFYCIFILLFYFHIKFSPFETKEMQGQVGHLGSFPCQDITILMNTEKKTHLDKFCNLDNTNMVFKIQSYD